MIATDLLRSPCCRAELDVSTPQALVCTSCRTSFPIRSFGPDLMPPNGAGTFPTHATWQAAQDALIAWRKRTWTGTPAAQAQVQRSVDLADAFVAWGRLTGAVLDIGCGTGWMHGLMPSVRYHGIDPLPFDQDYAFPFIRGVGDRLPFPDSTFDACCFYSSIVHAISVEASLAEAHRVLRAGGTLAIATMVYASKEPEGEHAQHYRFVEGELEALLAAQGLSDVTTLRYSPEHRFIRAYKKEAR